MNEETMRALKYAVRYKCMYEQCNPDVGIGPMPLSIVHEILHVAAISATPEETKSLERTASKMLKRN